MSVLNLIRRLPQGFEGVTALDLVDALWLASLGFLRAERADPALAHEDEQRAAPDDADAHVEADESSDDEPGEEETNGEEPEESSDSARAHESAAEVSVTPQAELHAPARKGIPARVPAARALPGARAIARSFRLLRRLVPSPTEHVIDEDRTAATIADLGIWFPSLVPARTRWLELALVLDTSSSMAIWSETLRELRVLLAQVGAFRDVRVWWLDTSHPEQAILTATPGGAPRSSKELLSPNGRRVVLVATDCIGPAWDAGHAAEFLKQWGVRQPVALLQLLPPRLWRRTALDPARDVRNVYVGAREGGVPNVSLTRQAWRAGPRQPDLSGVPIPLVTAEPESLEAWARLVRRGGMPVVPAVLFPDAAATPRGARRAEGAKRAVDPDEAIGEFERVASPPAYKLAGFLAAAPLRLPVMRLVQHTLLPESRQIHLAEFFLSRLIRSVGTAQANEPGSIDYDFIPGVREALLDASFTDDAIDVQRTVSRYVEGRLGQALDFDAILESPDDFDAGAINATDKAFARVSAQVLKRLGGKYAAVAARLVSPAPLQPSEHDAHARKFADNRIVVWSERPNGFTVVNALKNLGAQPLLITTLASAFVLDEHVDAVILDSRGTHNPFACIEVLDRFQSRGMFSPCAILTDSSETVWVQAEARHALACSEDLDDVLDALARKFRTPRAEWHRPPPHLGPIEERNLGTYISYKSGEDTAPDGSIDPGAAGRWKQRWRRASRSESTVTALLVSIFDHAMGAQICRLVSGWGELLAELAAYFRASVIEQKRCQEQVQRLQPYLLKATTENSQFDGVVLPYASLLVLPLGQRNPLQERLLVVAARRPYTFGPRQVQWMQMVARSAASHPDIRTDGPYLPEFEALLQRVPRPVQGACLLRTALRLEARARQRAKFGSSIEIRACRSLLEYTEAILCVPHEDWETSQPIRQRMMSLRSSLSDSSTRRTREWDVYGSLALRFAASAADVALRVPQREFKAGLRECDRGLAQLDTDERTNLMVWLKAEIQVARQAVTAVDAMLRLGPLWPPGTASPLPVPRRPSRFVCVAGTAGAGLEDVAAAVGHVLAAGGFGLVTGIWHGVDQHVTNAFLKRLQVWDLEPKEWLIQVIDPATASSSASGHFVFTRSELEALRLRLQRAHAVVLLQGGGYSRRLGHAAIKTDTFLFPIALTGGAADELYRRLVRTIHTKERLPWTRRALETASGHPFAAVVALADVIRRSTGRPALDVEQNGPELIPAELGINIVTVAFKSGPSVMGFVLAHPHVIVTVHLGGGRPWVASVVDADGNAHSVGPAPLYASASSGIVAYRIPPSLRATGLQCRFGGMRPGERLRVLMSNGKTRPMYVTSERMRRKSEPDPFKPQELFEIWRLELVSPHIPLEQQFVGLPAIDAAGRVRGVVTSRQDVERLDLRLRPGEPWLIPAFVWHRTLMIIEATTAPAKTAVAKKPASKKKSSKKK